MFFQQNVGIFVFQGLLDYDNANIIRQSFLTLKTTQCQAEEDFLVAILQACSLNQTYC
jgi:hypothetical protein